MVEFLPQIGDFVAADQPLFALYGAAAGIDERSLRATVAIGVERTLEQDPMFAFRILVDSAIKALSAINDPTTAVLAIDQIHRLLRMVGMRQLRGEVVHDEGGTARMILRTPDWEDYLRVACTEIRACGAAQVQIARRMRAMLENLVRSLPARRHDSLNVEIDLLDRTIERVYALRDDRELARIPDVQGIGGSSAASQAAANERR